MIRSRNHRIWLLAVLLAVMIVPVTLGSTPLQPREQIKAAVESVLETVRNQGLSPEVKKARLHAVLIQNFDFEEASKRALGMHRGKAEVRAKMQEFIPLFVELIESAYVNFTQIEKLGEIIFDREEVGYSQALVHSRIVLTNSDSAIEVVYKLHRQGEEWKIYDVAVMGVSMTGSYRSQFNQIITQHSFEELLKRLKEKELGNKGRR